MIAVQLLAETMTYVAEQHAASTYVPAKPYVGLSLRISLHVNVFAQSDAHRHIAGHGILR